MKEEYSGLSMEVVVFEVEDVIRMSPGAACSQPNETTEIPA